MRSAAPAFTGIAPAPFHTELSFGPADGRAVWMYARDGVRVRAALWLGPTRGTVLIFPGRTEYVEKYGPLAKDLAELGFSSLAIDWRGQGMADRLLPDERVGHVEAFTDYQMDVEALFNLAREEGAPEPYYLIGHSMGGGIGLRTALERHEIRACAFTGPMWGIRINPLMRPFAMAFANVMTAIGLDQSFAPSTKPENYLTANPFTDNTLTSDRPMWDFMLKQVQAIPGAALGGPSTHWVHEALTECNYLYGQASPAMRCLTVVGSNERIVDVQRITERMERWPQGRLMVIEGGEHEVLFERPESRARILEGLDATFN